MYAEHLQDTKTDTTGTQINAADTTMEEKIFTILKNTLLVAHVFDNVSQHFTIPTFLDS